MDGTCLVELERMCALPRAPAEPGSVDEARAAEHVPPPDPVSSNGSAGTVPPPDPVSSNGSAGTVPPTDPVTSNGGAGTAPPPDPVTNNGRSVPAAGTDLALDGVSSSPGAAEVARFLDPVSVPAGAAGMARALMDFPPALLARLLRHVSKEQGLGGPLHFALVCRRFAAFRFHATALRVRPACSLRAAADLARQLQEFRGPTLLELPPYLLKNPRDIWPALRGHHAGPTLTALATALGTRLNPLSSSSDPAEREREHGRVTRHFAVSALLPNPGLRTLRLSLASSVRARPWVLCSPPGPSPAVSLDELRALLPWLRRLSLDNVSPGWPHDWPCALPRLRSLHLRASCREGDTDANTDTQSESDPGTGAERCSFPWAVLALSGLTSLSLSPGNHSIQGRSFGRLTNLRRLAIRVGGPCGQPAPSIWRLTKLTSLSLDHDRYSGAWGDWGFEAFPAQVSRLTALRELTLSVRKAREGEEGVQERPAGVLQSLGKSLRVLRLTIHHKALVSQRTGVLLPRHFGACLSELRELALGGSIRNASLEAQLAGLVRLERLSFIRIEHAPLPLTLLSMSALRELHLKSCSTLRELPLWLATLAGLRRLSLDSCERLALLPPNLGQLRGLQSLELKCLPLRVLPGCLQALGKLRRLVLFGLQRLEHSALAGVELDHGSASKVYVADQTGNVFLPATPDTHDPHDTHDSLGPHDSHDTHRAPSDPPGLQGHQGHQGDQGALADVQQLDVRGGLGGLSSLSSLRELDIRRCTPGLRVLPQHLHRLTALRRLALGSSMVERADLDRGFLGSIPHVYIH